MFSMSIGIVYAQEAQENKSTSTEEVVLEDLIVGGKQLFVPTMQVGDAVYTGTQLTKNGIELSGQKGKSNVYEAVSIIPGVMFEGTDPNNMATEQANVRIRGVRGYLGAMTVNGIPNYGGNPMGPRAYIYDMENFDSVAVYKGAVPADLGVGVGNRGGALELRPLWAKEQFGITLSPTYGSYDYKKMYVRMDTGTLPLTKSRFSASYSYSQEDKWKGPGDMGPRHNANVTYIQPLGQHVDIQLWGNVNNQKHYKYRSLTYQQVQFLNALYNYDFNPYLTGVASEDKNYYKYNYEKHQNTDFFASINIAFKPVFLTFKPYISDEDATIKDGTTISINPGGQKPGVQERTRDIQRKGIIGEIVTDFSKLKATVGYHFEKSGMDIFTENYEVQNNGVLLYRGYGVFATSGATYVNSPYAKIAGNFGRFKCQGGVKYFRFKDSETEGYTTTIVNNIPVINRNPYLDRKGKIYDAWLPTAGISYSLTNELEAYTSYGRNFIRPYAYMPLVSLYNRLLSQFQAAGITLNDLFKGYDIEQSDTVDAGIRYKSDIVELTPTVFVSRHKNLLTNVTDFRIYSDGKPISYQQNIGKAKGYGGEMGINVFIMDYITIFFNPTYNKLVYDGDVVYQGISYNNDGKQIVDVPRWSFTCGVIGRYKGFELSPIVRYIGTRYGDVTHLEKVDSYYVSDIRISYTHQDVLLLRSIKISLELDNIFNKKYVSVINAMDDAVSGTTYYVGAPFNIKGSVSCTF
jgi:iron complex outermembrane receptor protein